MPIPTTALVDQPTAGHNRFHPAIPPKGTLRSGETITVPTLDGCDLQVTRATTAQDLLQMTMQRSHPMTGPFAVEGAEPGHVLEVEVLELEPADYGWTMLLPGTGHLRDLITEPFVAHWEIADNAARSEQLPGITIAGRPFLGIMGVAPGAAEHQRYLARERALEAAVRRSPARPPPSRTASPSTARACAPSARASAAATSTSSSSPPAVASS